MGTREMRNLKHASTKVVPFDREEEVREPASMRRSVRINKLNN